MQDSDVLKRYLAEEMVEEYEEGRLSRRSMLKVVAQILGVVTVGPALLASLGCSTTTSGGATKGPDAAPAPTGPTDGVTVKEDDPDISVSKPTIPGDAGEIQAYLARPKGNGSFPAVILIHENRGLTEHNRDVARRFAKVGYAALAVDLLSRVGGTAQFKDAADATAAIAKVMPNDVVADLRASAKWLEAQAYASKGKLAAIGWCWGGGMAWRFATAEPNLKAVAAFYGPNPPLEAVPGIQAAVLGVYGANDKRITDAKGTLEEALKKAGKTFEIKVFEGADHAFFNDTGARFSPAAAKEAWALTLDFFAKHVK